MKRIRSTVNLWIWLSCLAGTLHSFLIPSALFSQLSLALPTRERSNLIRTSLETGFLPSREIIFPLASAPR